jgi:nitroreductase
MAMTALGLTVRQLDAVLSSAVRAPSLHNSQPWSFVAAPDRIELHVDLDRLLPVADPHLRETRIGCGAALFNLRLALVRHGVKPVVTLLPNGPDGPVAVVGSTGTILSPQMSEMAELDRAIAHRRTNRRPFDSAEVPLGHRHILTRAAEAEGAILHLIDDPARLRQIQERGAIASWTQLSNPAWVAEWDAWTRCVGTDDGVPLSAAGPVPTPQDPFTRPDFGAPGRPERIDGENFEERPLIVILATYADTPIMQIIAGQAMERVLLAATALGLSASFLSQLIEVPSANAHVRALIGGNSHPQVVMRVGFGSPSPVTPRRPVADCVRTPEPFLDGTHHARA